MEQLELFNTNEIFIPSGPSFFEKKRQEQLNIIEDIKKRKTYKTDLFYTPSEIQLLLGISYYRVFYLIKFFRIDAIKIHSCLRIPAASLIEYMEDYTRINALERAYYRWIHSREANSGFVA